MLRHSLLVCCAAAALACGGDRVTSPTPALPPITRVEIQADTVLLFTGHKTPLQRFVVKAYDSTGAVVSDPVLTIHVPPGFVVTGDTIIAPANESAGRIRVLAKRRQSGAAANRVAGDGLRLDVVGDSGASDSVSVVAAINLADYSWRASWACQGGSLMFDGIAGQVDSILFGPGAITHITYPADSTWIRNWDGVAQITWRGPRALYQHDSLVRVDTVEFTPASVFRQAPDSLVFYSPGLGNNPETGNGQWPIHLVSAAGAKRVYEGGSWCAFGVGGPTLHPVTFSEQ